MSSYKAEESKAGSISYKENTENKCLNLEYRDSMMLLIYYKM